MRVFRRSLILGGLLWALAAAPANATPILSSDSGVACDDVLGVVNSNCSLFSFDTSEGSRSFEDLVFASDADVALFKITTAGATTFLPEITSSSGLFLPPLLGLFNDDDTKSVYLNDAGEMAVALERLEGVSLAGDSTYYLAVMLSSNYVLGIPSPSLSEGFACDGVDEVTGESPCPGGGTVTLNFSAIPVDGGPQPVPEPGTLTLVGGVAVAALARRRSIRRNQRKNASRS